MDKLQEPITSQYAEKMFNDSVGQEKMKWFEIWMDTLRYEDTCKRNFINNVLVPNYGFRKGRDTLTFI